MNVFHLQISKKRAAEKMLEQLRTLPPTTTITAPGCASSLSRAKRKATTGKKKSRNIIKETPVAQVRKIISSILNQHLIIFDRPLILFFLVS